MSYCLPLRGDIQLSENILERSIASKHTSYALRIHCRHEHKVVCQLLEHNYFNRDSSSKGVSRAALIQWEVVKLYHGWVVRAIGQVVDESILR